VTTLPVRIGGAEISKRSRCLIVEPVFPTVAAVLITSVIGFSRVDAKQSAEACSKGSRRTGTW
jgi:hypothetical protein